MNGLNAFANNVDSEEEDNQNFSSSAVFAKIKPKEESKSKLMSLKLKNLKLPKREEISEPKPVKKLSNLMSLGKAHNVSEESDQETVNVTGNG